MKFFNIFDHAENCHFCKENMIHQLNVGFKKQIYGTIFFKKMFFPTQIQ